MGCIHPRQHDNDFIEAVYFAERKLGFSTHQPGELDLLFRKWAHDGKLNKAQLYKIQQQAQLMTLNDTDLKQDKEGTWDSEYSVTKFYRNFVSDSDQSKLSLFKVILASTAMSGGSSADRASVIFDNLDIDSTGKIGKNNIQQYYDVLDKLTHEYLLDFSDGHFYPQEPSRTISKLQIETQKKQWAEHQFEDYFLKALLPKNSKIFDQQQDEEIDKETFIQRITNPEFGDFTSTYGVRQFHSKAELL